MLGYEKNGALNWDCNENAHEKTLVMSPHMPNHRVIVIVSQDHNYLEAKGQLYHMGAHFEALYIGILMAGSD